MIYVMSDLHGEYRKYLSMLEKIDFSDEDTLYLLGDYVDRGDGGVQILLDIMERKNVIPLLGNHDWTMMTLLKNEKQLVEKLGKEGAIDLFRLWFYDGGRETYRAFREQPKENRQHILAYLADMDYIAEITVNGQAYFLSHTLPDFRTDIPLKEREADAFLHGEANYDRRYLENAVTVTGHVPTALIHASYRGKIWKGNGHIAVDCGAFFTGTLGCLCLENLKEYYVTEELSNA